MVSVGEIFFGSGQAGMFGCGGTVDGAPDQSGEDGIVDGGKGEATLDADRLITWKPILLQEMKGPDTSNWQTASWSNGDPFDCTWQPDNVTFREGIMIITLDDAGCPQSCDGKPFASGEYRTTQEVYGYGYYEARMKAARGDGLVSSFFTYTGTYGKENHHEIDFEFLGKNCGTVQTNYYTQGKGGHEKMIDLGFDACDGFHNYGFNWSKDALVFYVDGKAVHSVAGGVPSKPGKIIANFWPGTGVDGWLNPFSYPGKPLQAEYDWIAFSPLDASDAVQP